MERFLISGERRNAGRRRGADEDPGAHKLQDRFHFRTRELGCDDVRNGAELPDGEDRLVKLATVGKRDRDEVAVAHAVRRQHAGTTVGARVQLLITDGHVVYDLSLIHI